MENTVVIVDYERSNIYNVQCALKYIGVENMQVSSEAEIILNAEKLILPGVGAFPDAMQELRKKKLDEIICQFAISGKPLLGICLGMQLLLESSEEFGVQKGLNLIPGQVRSLKHFMREKSFRIPHIGWSSLKSNEHFESDINKKNGQKLIEGIEKDTAFYFAHSFVSVPHHKKDILAVTEYGGVEFCSIVNRENITGCQFHPERSGKWGLKILKNFLEII